jgi:hypothetical protein
MSRIHDQVFESACALISTGTLKLPAQRIEKQLQGGQTLLPVDDGALLHCAGRVLELLKHNSPEKMWLTLGIRLTQDSLCHPGDVDPQGLPLIVLVPYVRTLE